MSIRITVTQKGARVETIDKIIEEAVRKKYPDCRVVVERRDPAESRGDRFEQCKDLIEDAIGGADELKDELQDWLSNMPESLQDSDKSGQIQEAIDNLEAFVDDCESAKQHDVDFPQMMG